MPLRNRSRIPSFHREALRTNLWLLPALFVVGAAILFSGTYALDRAAGSRSLHLPDWVATGSADAARQVLIGIAAAVITVAGVVFSITILALQLASQQFGPRMLRNFMRDRGTQVTLGLFVGSFAFTVLGLASVGTGSGYDFVPHLTVTVALGLTLLDLGMLIYFIHHVATSIQLTSVVSGIARDFVVTAGELRAEAAALAPLAAADPSVEDLSELIDREGAMIPAVSSGFLQAVGHDRLVEIATSSDAVIRLLHRPGHFVVAGLPLASVWPADAAASVTSALDRAHVIGPHRTLTQDVGFAVDQLVEVAIRALSPAVNDTFTALNCIDWLGAALCEVTAHPLPDGIYRDHNGHVRLIDSIITYERMVKGAHDKVRQAAQGVPAVLIRQLENLQKVMQSTTSEPQRQVLLRHAHLIMRAAEASVAEESDKDDVRVVYDALVSALGSQDDRGQ